MYGAAAIDALFGKDLAKLRRFFSTWCQSEKLSSPNYPLSPGEKALIFRDVKESFFLFAHNDKCPV